MAASVVLVGSGAFCRGCAAKLFAWRGALGGAGRVAAGHAARMAEISRFRVCHAGVLEGRCWKGRGKAMRIRALAGLGT